MSDTDPVVEDAVQKLVSTGKEVIGDGKVSLANILQLVVSFMRTVEQLPKMTGIQKKNAVITAVVAIMKASGSDAGLLEVVPSFIDIVIGVNNDGLVIEPVVAMQGCCMSLCNLLKCGSCSSCGSCGSCSSCCASKKSAPSSVQMN